MSPAQDLASHLTNPSGCQAFAPRRAAPCSPALNGGPALTCESTKSA